MPETFARKLLRWYDRCGRKDLPWQHPRTPYRVWLSEIMLQQTQVATATAYFDRFVCALPDLPSLAAAPEERVLALWSGLGYYQRAKNLHRAAQRCMELHAGQLPASLEALAALPGIGPSTAGAIMAQAFGARCAILDGNVKRVLARYCAIEQPIDATATVQRLWAHSRALLPHRRLPDYTQALMDLGATTCRPRQPACQRCPVASGCAAHRVGVAQLLPRKTKKAKTATRERVFLLLQDGRGRILLQKRPPRGVWASLWSLPEHASARPTARTLGQTYRVAVESRHWLAPRTHRFTHFSLLMRPLLVQVRRDARAGNHSDQVWIVPHDDALQHLGIPAPIREILLAPGLALPDRRGAS